MKRWLSLALVCLFAPLCYGQTLQNPLQGPIQAASASCVQGAATCVWMKLAANQGTVAVTITGTFSATLVVEESSDSGVTFTTLSTLTAITTATQFSVAGMTDFRVRASAYTSGSALVFLQSSTASGSSSSGASSAAPVIGTYLSNSCQTSNTGQCYFTAANTQEANSCGWTAATPSTVTCLAQVFGATASVTGNVATYTIVSVPTTWVAGNSITVTGFTGGDTFFNQTCTISSTTTTTIVCPLTHANASSGSFAYIANNNVGPFVAGDVGKQVMGWNSCVADVNTTGTNAISAAGAPTITSFISNTQVQISTAANANASGGCFMWGTPDDANAATMEAAYLANATSCPKVFLAASNYWFNTFHFNGNPAGCINQPAAINNVGFGATGGFASVYYPSGFELEGRGTGNTLIYLGANFPTGTCSNGRLTNGCFAIPPLGRWRDFQITGGGNYLATNAPNSKALVYCEICELDKVTITNWANTNALQTVMCVETGYQAQLTLLNVSACSIGIDISGSTGLVNGFRVYSENSNFRTLSVDGPPGTSGAALQTSFTCAYCGFYTLVPAAAGINTVFNAGGSIYLYNSQIGPLFNEVAANGAYRCQSGSCVLSLRDSFVKVNGLTGDVGLFATAGSSGSIILENTSITTGATGAVYTDTATSKFYDYGRNTYSGAAFSTTGQVIGVTNSATGTACATGNFALTSGWGTSSVASVAANGNIQACHVTITGAAGGAGPVLTWTYPVAPPIAPASCQLTGTTASLTGVSVGTPGATSVAFTFVGTPTAVTYTFDVGCK